MGLVRKSNAPRFIAVRMLDIADALSMQIQRLNELYAETNQVGFIGRLGTDGAPVLEEAFVRVKLA
jgi:HK97 family phage major capsid protein